MILHLDGIECKEEELIESPKMRYYRDLIGDYYYLEDSGKKINYNKIVKHDKEAAEMVLPSDTDVDVISSTLVDMKTLIGDVLQRFLIDQDREDQIMAHIIAFSHVSEDNRLRMKIELMVEIKEEIQAFEGCLATQIEALKGSIDYLSINNFIFHNDIEGERNTRKGRG